MIQNQNNYDLRGDEIYLEDKLIATISDGVISYASGKIKRFHAEAVNEFLSNPTGSQLAVVEKSSEYEQSKVETEQLVVVEKSINSDLMEDDLLEPPLPALDRFFGCYTYGWFVSDLYRLGKDGFFAKWIPFRKNNKEQYDGFMKQLEDSEYSNLTEIINNK
ncbi:MAG: hypothetical protein RR506_06530 [Akkermansia sp.]